MGNAYAYYRISTPGQEDMDDPAGIYNIELSPARYLYRHLPRILSFITSGVLQYQTTDKNPELASNIGTGMIVETANIDLTQTSFSETRWRHCTSPIL